MKLFRILAALALAAAVPAARAGFTATDSLQNTSTLRNGTVYRVPSDLRVTSNGNGGNAFRVADGATAVLYIPKGVTLTANGGDASGTTGAGAGIRLDNTLVLLARTLLDLPLTRLMRE